MHQPVYARDKDVRNTTVQRSNDSYLDLHREPTIRNAASKSGELFSNLYQLV